MTMPVYESTPLDILPIPETFVNERVAVSLRGLIGNQNGNMGYVQIPGTFLGQTATTIRIRTDDKSVFGFAGIQVIPKDTIQCVNQVGNITMLAPGSQLRS